MTRDSENVPTDHQKFEEQLTQSQIDDRIKEMLGYQQEFGATITHLMPPQPNLQRPRLPVLVPPASTIGTSNQAPTIPRMVTPPLAPLPVVRKQHRAGDKHKANVRTHYQQYEDQQAQNLIDQRIKEHLGAQILPINLLMANQPNIQRPHVATFPVTFRPLLAIPNLPATLGQPSTTPAGVTFRPMQMNTLPGPPPPAMYRAVPSTVGPINPNSPSAPTVPEPAPTVTAVPTAPPTTSGDNTTDAPTSGTSTSSSIVPDTA